MNQQDEEVVIFTSGDKESYNKFKEAADKGSLVDFRDGSDKWLITRLEAIENKTRFRVWGRKVKS